MLQVQVQTQIGCDVVISLIKLDDGRSIASRMIRCESEGGGRTKEKKSPVFVKRGRQRNIWTK